MATRTGLPVLIAVAWTALTAACVEVRVPREDRAQARLDARQEELLAAQRARDADRMAALFAADAVLHVANRPPIEGRVSVGQFYAAAFKFLSDTRSTVETVHVSGSGDLAYQTGSVVNEFRGPDGVVQYAGKYVIIWREVEGDWMIAFYGVSSNQAAERQP